jgi:endonuclease-3
MPKHFSYVVDHDYGYAPCPFGDFCTLANGLRVLLRLGFGEEKQSYSTTYRLVQQAAGEGIDKDYPWLIEAHLLLRSHGQELCRRSEPLCDKCPLAPGCEFYQRGDG